ncbi:MAG: beta-phosphoglucomutase family hydrolase [Spirochaetia bacterium]|nr:beta-phosphoglucomutase family hydrolase [Spirochaetia bacterium]
MKEKNSGKSPIQGSFKGAIFDVDGVIVDTAHIHHKSWEAALEKYGIKLTFEDFKSRVDGKPRAKGAKTIMPGLNDAGIEELCAEKQRNFERILKTGNIKVFGSTLKLIKELKKRGIKIAMASSSRNAGTILKKVGVYTLFDAEIEGGLLPRGKPYPDIFLLAAAGLKLKPSECVVFEDAQIGINAAINGNIRCVAVNRDTTHMIKGANLRVRDLREVSYKKLENLFK